MCSMAGSCLDNTGQRPFSVRLRTSYVSCENVGDATRDGHNSSMTIDVWASSSHLFAHYDHSLIQPKACGIYDHLRLREKPPRLGASRAALTFNVSSNQCTDFVLSQRLRAAKPKVSETDYIHNSQHHQEEASVVIEFDTCS